MTGHQRRSWRYPNLVVTIKNETDERSVTEISSKSRKNYSKNERHSHMYSYPTTVYYNSNYRYQQSKQHYHNASSSKTECHTNSFDYSYYKKSQEPIRPLMDIPDSALYPYNEFKNTNVYSNYKVREPRQRGQYRNRKAELDWDHGFDLDQTALYTTSNDIDNRSLTSVNSSENNSLSSI